MFLRSGPRGFLFSAAIGGDHLAPSLSLSLLLHRVLRLFPTFTAIITNIIASLGSRLHESILSSACGCAEGGQSIWALPLGPVEQALLQGGQAVGHRVEVVQRQCPQVSHQRVIAVLSRTGSQYTLAVLVLFVVLFVLVVLGRRGLVRQVRLIGLAGLAGLGEGSVREVLPEEVELGVEGLGAESLDATRKTSSKREEEEVAGGGEDSQDVFLQERVQLGRTHCETRREQAEIGQESFQVRAEQAEPLDEVQCLCVGESNSLHGSPEESEEIGASQAAPGEALTEPAHEDRVQGFHQRQRAILTGVLQDRSLAEDLVGILTATALATALALGQLIQRASGRSSGEESLKELLDVIVSLASLVAVRQIIRVGCSAALPQLCGHQRVASLQPLLSLPPLGTERCRGPQDRLVGRGQSQGLASEEMVEAVELVGGQLEALVGEQVQLARQQHAQVRQLRATHALQQRDEQLAHESRRDHDEAIAGVVLRAEPLLPEDVGAEDLLEEILPLLAALQQVRRQPRALAARSHQEITHFVLCEAQLVVQELAVFPEERQRHLEAGPTMHEE